jgi:xanthine dehydrogenase accessory factor
VTPALLHRIQAARAAKRPVALATRLADGAQHLLPDPSADADLRHAVEQALARDESRSIELGGETWFLQVYNPPFRLLIVGAVHIAQAMLPMAAALGWAAIVIDPRRAFASAERFPGVALMHDWPDEALATLQPDSRTALVALTHDPKIDDPALDAVLRGPALYVGALGGRKSHAARLRRLARLGHDEAALARIFGPVGLNLEAVTAPEIAVSIVAEIVAVRRNAALARREAFQAAA